MDKCGKLGLSLSVVQTQTKGAWAGITSLDFDRDLRWHTDPQAVIFTPDGPGGEGTFPAKGSAYDVYFHPDHFPRWGGGFCLYLGRFDKFPDPEAYSSPYPSSYDIPREKGGRRLDITHIKVFKLKEQPTSRWTASFHSRCRQALQVNQYIPMDELDAAKGHSGWIIRPYGGVAVVNKPELLKSSNPAFNGAKSVSLSCTLTEQEVNDAVSELAELFHDNPPTATGLNRPHTLILKEPNDNLIKALTSSGTVKGIARLVVEKVNDMNAVAESLENVELFEEVVLKGGAPDMSLRKFIQSSQNFKFKQIDPQPSYDQPPEELEKKIKDMQKQMEPLVELQLVDKSECAMVLRCSWGKVWPLRKDQVSRIGMLKKALEAGCGQEEKEIIPDAGLMVPTPGEEATMLARHFLNEVDEAAAGTAAEGGNAWPLSFESFFAQHLEPRDESDAEVRKCCWLLAEMWGIACYLEIADLRMFCRSAWVLLTGGGHVDSSGTGSMITSYTGDETTKRSKRRREDE